MAINENTKVWEGVYANFSEVRTEETVFEESIWLAKIMGRARQQVAQSDDDSAVAAVALTSDYALPFVAALTVRRGQSLRILDFGGGMGTSYLPLVKMLPVGQPIDFVVVENAAVCRAGAEFFEGDEGIRFKEDIPPPGQEYGIVHCGSSLHYIDEWEHLLDKFVALQPQYLLFADLPAADNRSFVTTQLFHGQRICVRFWNFAEFVEAVEKRGFELVFRSRYRGYYLEKDASPPTGDFDELHRLDYFSQLVFRRVDSQNRQET